jgi:nucleotide-binding universal stress UspA family protein
MAMLIAPNAEVWIIHVYVAPFDGRLWSAGVLNDEMEKYRVEARQQALIRIDTLMRKVEDPQHRLFRIVEHGDAPRLILAKEEEHEADLIVMGKHGQSVLEEMFLGSVTRHILANSKCDVLIVH